MMAVEVLADRQAPGAEPKLFVLVRRDLPWPVRTVQAIHAAIQFVHGQMAFKSEWWHPKRPLSVDVDRSWGRHGPSVVLLGVTNEAELAAWHGRLPDSAMFREPDLLDAATSVAYYGEPVDGLADLRLL